MLTIEVHSSFHLLGDSLDLVWALISLLWLLLLIGIDSLKCWCVDKHTDTMKRFHQYFYLLRPDYVLSLFLISIIVPWLSLFVQLFAFLSWFYLLLLNSHLQKSEIKNWRLIIGNFKTLKPNAGSQMQIWVTCLFQVPMKSKLTFKCFFYHVCHALDLICTALSGPTMENDNKCW